MKQDRAYLVATHRFMYKAGEPAEIVGVDMITPDDELQPRACFRLKYSDDYIDWVPIEDGHYQIIGFQDIINGSIPKVTE